MGKVVLANCLVTTEKDWIPVVLEDDLCALAIEKGTLQEEQSKRFRLKDRAIDKSPERSLRCSIGAKRAEYAVHQYFGRQARVTEPGEFHDYPDVGQVNVRFIGDPQDGLMIQERDQGDVPMVLCTSFDPTFSDKTIWLVGWGETDLLRRHFYMINQFRPNPNWGLMGNDLEPHEQFIYPRAMLNRMKTLSKEFVNTPFEPKKK